MPNLRIACSNPKIKPVDLSATLVSIGRHPDNVITLVEDKVASRFHCVIEATPDGGFLLKDLGARNGTRVNGETITAISIAEGDVITVGQHSFTVEQIEYERPKPANGQPTAPKASEVAAAATTDDSKTPWARRLRAMIDDVPPRNAPLPKIALIDAHGDRSEALDSSGEGSTAVRLMLQLAARTRATDIHVEPLTNSIALRMRVDGQMVGLLELPSSVGTLTLGLIRNACHMKQAAPNEVLEGHIAVEFPDRKVDYRVSITPTMRGQKLVLRVLDSVIAPQSLRDMNLPIYMYDRLKSACREDAGMILAVGPTGSGKTTTLYNSLREIDRTKRNVVTIEDPVEYSIDGCTQIPITHNTSFASLLKSILRQDPDVILVGEVRDEETARTTMQAAMTGHLVFSTVHAKDTIGSIFRLFDLGVEPYLIASSMDLVIAQRLVRVLCESCKRPVRVTPGQATRMGRFLSDKTELYAATGCTRCLRIGFHGRRAIFEMLEFNDELRDCVLNQPSISKMRKIITQGVFTSLTQSGWLLASGGITSLDEVERVTGG